MAITYRGNTFERKDWMRLASAIRELEQVDWMEAQERAKALLGCGIYGDNYCPPIPKVYKQVPRDITKAYTPEDIDKLYKKRRLKKKVAKKVGVLELAGKIFAGRENVPLTDYSSVKFSPWKLLEAEPGEEVKIYDSYGNVDFIKVFPNEGFAYVADSSGHNYVAKGKTALWKKLDDTWYDFNNWVSGIPGVSPPALDPNFDLDTKASLLDAKLLEVHKAFQEKIGTASTFTSFLVSNDEPLYITGIGDSLLIAVPVTSIGKVKNATILSGPGTSPKLTNPAASGNELGSTIANAQKTQWKLPRSDDVYLFLMTDGVFDVLNGTGERHDTQSNLKALEALVDETVYQGFDAEYLRDRIVETVIDSYNMHGPIGTGKIGEKDHDDSSVAVVHLSP